MIDDNICLYQNNKDIYNYQLYLQTMSYAQ